MNDCGNGDVVIEKINNINKNYNNFGNWNIFQMIIILSNKKNNFLIK